ncbi:hypothetical protein QVD17_38022 [Tagetes erecta]|uniref:Reverse transcriptase zinc-binding domain-containing protein n=1 Tax=Tagetes erecta TaxID=13708 RepID=A0AAD8JX61_TARER|nr:hypothetical protein QVD17_38022 [Tagetes erecta]
MVMEMENKVAITTGKQSCYHNKKTSYNRIPTCDALRRRGVALSSLVCSLCGEEEESVEHLFVTCRFSANIFVKDKTFDHKCTIRDHGDQLVMDERAGGTKLRSHW